MQRSWYRLLSESERQARSYFSSLLCLRKHKSLKIRFWSLFWCMSWRLFQGRWKKRFFFCCFFIQRVFIPNRKPVRKTGAALEKNLSLFYNNPSIIADQCHELLIVTFSRISIPEKNVSLQLSQHPQVKDSKDSNLLNGCDIYRTSAPRNYEKKGKEETIWSVGKTWKNFWAKQINAPTCRIITKNCLICQNCYEHENFYQARCLNKFWTLIQQNHKRKKNRESLFTF